MGLLNKCYRLGRVLSLVYLLSLTVWWAIPTQAQSPVVGQAAPAFALKGFDGVNRRLSDYYGQVLMLNFWASWCRPCRQELPVLQTLQDKYARYGFQVVGVNVEEDLAKAQAFAEQVQVSFMLLHDNEQRAVRAYQVEAMPTSVFISRSGELLHIHAGYRSGDEQAYDRLIAELLKR